MGTGDVINHSLYGLPSLRGGGEERKKESRLEQFDNGEEHGRALVKPGGNDPPAHCPQAFEGWSHYHAIHYWYVFW